MGFPLLMMGIVAAVVGGIGTLRGAVVGSWLLAGAQHLVTWTFGSEWQDAVAFALLFLALLLRPHGLLRSSAEVGRA